MYKQSMNVSKGGYNVIVGLGVTGFACAEYLLSNGTPFVIIDTRDNPPRLEEFKTLYPLIDIYTGGFPATVMASADRVILSPGIPQEHPDLIKSLPPQVEVIGDVELFARSVEKPVVAITGSNGKSTVTSLVGEMAKNAGIKVGVGGNLGVPVLRLLIENPDLFVLELSSFQLETTYSLKPAVSTVLNICPDHMDRYPSLEAYRLAKYRIFNNCKQIVVNRDEPILPYSLPEDFPIISFGLDSPPPHSVGNHHLNNIHYGLIEHKREIWIARGKIPLLSTKKLKIFGRHNISNALAALALGESVNLPLEAMLAVLQLYPGLAHRCEQVREFKGVQWINDSKGTNVGATVSALRGLATAIPGKWVLIAGGQGKNADFTPLRDLLQQHCRSLITIGEAAEELYDLFKNLLPCVRAKSLEEAVFQAENQAKPGDGVLLSPACASLDMFKNFEDRGDIFKEIVRRL